ncbi:hypothetical protein M434DRAFT_367293 [Hypoxylon sp. CO27-5]|nr:hypothetical protein M434DRAFT_367293 [Hypoxylon sp. CO27-5]
MILIPLNSLSVELPLVFRSRWAAFVSVMWFCARISYGIAVNLSRNTGAPWVIFLTMGRLMVTMFALMLPFTGLFGPTLATLERGERRTGTENLFSIVIRAWYHIAYASIFFYGINGPMIDTPRHVWHTLFYSQFLCQSRIFCYFELAAVFSALASLAYWIALWTGQEYVFSRTLGGPGVECMTFIRPGRVSQNDAIGLEEGRIRL